MKCNSIKKTVSIIILVIVTYIVNYLALLGIYKYTVGISISIYENNNISIEKLSDSSEAYSYYEIYKSRFNDNYSDNIKEYRNSVVGIKVLSTSITKNTGYTVIQIKNRVLIAQYQKNDNNIREEIHKICGIQ